MLWLLLSIEGERFALESGDVLEILPWSKLRTMHQAPSQVAGVLEYRDLLIPVLDLSQILYGRSCRLHTCTRIILVQRDVGQFVGLLAQQVAQTRKISQFEQTQLKSPVIQSPFVKTVLSDPQGVIQCIQMEPLLAAAMPTPV